MPLEVAAVLLAAGAGTRFGGNKLMADLAGKPLGLHAAEALRALDVDHNIAICRSDGALLPLLVDLGFTVIRNDASGAGLSRSLALGAAACSELGVERMLVALADMPFVTTAHLAGLIGADEGEPVASSAGLVATPPALFPKSWFGRLARLEGDQGARTLLANARRVFAPSAELDDIDTREDLANYARPQC